MPDSAEIKLLKKVKKTRTCWLWQGGTNLAGYGIICLWGDTYFAHRASYMIFVGPIPKGKMVLHKCDIPNCIKPKHLYAGTAADNMRDTQERGRAVTGDDHWTRRNRSQTRGENNSFSKFTNAKVKRLRRLAERRKYTQRKLAKMFGVAQSTVYHVLSKRTWSHVR